MEGYPSSKLSLVFYLSGHKYPKTGIEEIYGKTSVRVCGPIQMIPLHFRGTYDLQPVLEYVVYQFICHNIISDFLNLFGPREGS